MGNQYEPKHMTNIVYGSLIGIGVLFTIIRWLSAFDYRFLVFNQEVNSHINNFSFSLIFYLVVGNLLCETVMGFMNTIDIIDAVYGIIATILIFFAHN